MATAARHGQRFDRSLLLAIPASLAEEDESDIIRAFRKVLAAV